jgi:hypothetical protein
MGCGMFTWNLLHVAEDAEAKKWPHQPGTIVSTELRSDPISKRPRYFVVPHYKFNVDGREFEGETLSFTADSESKDLAEEERAKYPDGTKVEVYFDPKEPTKSCLLPGAGEESAELMMAFSLLLAVLGVIGVLIRKWKARKLI